MAWYVEYNGKKVNPAWKEQIRSSDSLTSSQKKQLINSAYKDVVKHNAIEAVWFVVKIIASIVFLSLLYYLFFYVFR